MCALNRFIGESLPAENRSPGHRMVSSWLRPDQKSTLEESIGTVRTLIAKLGSFPRP